VLDTLAMSQPAASNPHLMTLLRHADAAVDATLLARATTGDQITEALRRGADGIVTSVDDVFATSANSTKPSLSSPINSNSTARTSQH
jgi:hypothetical protein